MTLTTRSVDLDDVLVIDREMFFVFHVYSAGVWVRDVSVVAGSAAIAWSKAPRMLDDGEQLVAAEPRLLDPSRFRAHAFESLGAAS